MSCTTCLSTTISQPKYKLARIPVFTSTHKFTTASVAEILLACLRNIITSHADVLIMFTYTLYTTRAAIHGSNRKLDMSDMRLDGRYIQQAGH